MTRPKGAKYRNLWARERKKGRVIYFERNIGGILQQEGEA